MKKFRKRHMMLALVMIFFVTAIFILISNTFAFYKQDEGAENFLYAKHFKVDLIDDFVASGFVLPGDKLNKDVYMKNNGEVDSVVRIKLTPTWTPETDINGKVLDTEVVEVDLGDTVMTDWTLKSDGWYYYNKILKPGESTSLLVDSIRLIPVSNDLHDTDYSNSQYTLDVNSQSIQAISVAAEENWGHGFNIVGNNIQWLDPTGGV